AQPNRERPGAGRLQEVAAGVSGHRTCLLVLGAIAVGQPAICPHAPALHPPQCYARETCWRRSGADIASGGRHVGCLVVDCVSNLLIIARECRAFSCGRTTDARIISSLVRPRTESQERRRVIRAARVRPGRKQCRATSPTATVTLTRCGGRGARRARPL